MLRAPLLFLVAGLAIAIPASLLADEPANAAKSAPSNDVPLSDKMVAVELVIAEFTAAEKEEDPLRIPSDEKSVTQRLKELDGKGKLGWVSHVQLTTLDQMEASLQMGETAPTVRSVMMRGPANPARGDRAGGGGPGLGPAVSYAMVQTGTIVRVLPKVTEDGTVLMNLSVERTRLTPKKIAADGALGDEPQGSATLTAKSTIRVEPNHSTLTSSAKDLTAEGKTELVIIVSAQVLDRPKRDR